MAAGFAYENNQADHWLTPPEILKPLGLFDLDPCGFPGWVTAWRHYLLPDENGLLLPWSGRVWCNPPYGREIPKWVERMALHRHGTMLIFARTDTQAFAGVWKCADSILFLTGRVRFFRPDGTRGDAGTAPSCLAAFGPQDVAALTVAANSGHFKGALLSAWTHR